jgi:hypothetical protein
MLKINFPHADPESRETRQRAYRTAQRPTGALPTRRVGEPNRGPGLSRGLGGVSIPWVGYGILRGYDCSG